MPSRSASSTAYRALWRPPAAARSAHPVIAYLTGDTRQTPYTLFYDALEADRYFGAGLDHGTLSWLLDNHGVRAQWIANDAEAITEALKNNHPVIAHMGPGTFTQKGHYIVLRGVTDDGMIVVNDPASSARTGRAFPIDLLLREAKTSAAFAVCSVRGEQEPEPTAQPAHSLRIVMPRLRDESREFGFHASFALPGEEASAPEEFTLKSGEEKAFENLSAGTEFTLEMDAADGYFFAVTPPDDARGLTVESVNGGFRLRGAVGDEDIVIGADADGALCCALECLMQPGDDFTGIRPVPGSMTLEELLGLDADVAGAAMWLTGNPLIMLTDASEDGRWSFDVYYMNTPDDKHIEETYDFDVRYQSAVHRGG